MSKLNLVVCSSASFYTEIIELSYELEKLGIIPLLPSTALKIKLKKENNIEAINDWSKSSKGYHGKAELIKKHFNEISKGHAILVANYKKHGLKNYIGPNVLMEMAIAFHLGKPIYVLNDCPKLSPLVDEILGLEPIFLKGNLSGLAKKAKP